MKLLLIILALTSACHARIGDTLEQCAQRYGKVTGRAKVSEHLPPQHIFAWDGIRVAIYLGDDGKCMHITYTANGDAPLSKDQVREFLALNRGVGTWKPRKPQAKKITDWENKKRGLHAHFSEKSAQGSNVSISSQDFRTLIRDLDWEIRHAKKK